MIEIAGAVKSALENGEFISATISAPYQRKIGPKERVRVRPVTVKGLILLQFETRDGAKAKHSNLSRVEAEVEISRLLQESYKQAVISTTVTETRLVLNGSRELTVHAKPATRAAPRAEHDRQKSRIIPEGKPCEFLVRLNVMTPDGRVISSRFDKFRQINRFLEVVEDVFCELNTAVPLRIVDFGCGKSYLTFALYHYLCAVKAQQVSIVGLDLKEDVIAECEQIARDLSFGGLSFQVGDIGSFTGLEGTDMVVCLHACDTATDDALAAAIAAEVKIILAVPCCQHELFRKIRCEELEPLLKYGIFKERLNALVTDSLRAQFLESAGYTVQVLEFVESEHTSKNVLIRAVRQPIGARREHAAAEYARYRAFWQVTPYIETALAARRERRPRPDADCAGL